MVRIGDHLRFGIICGLIWGSFPVWGSFAVGDHLQRCTVPKRKLHPIFKVILLKTEIQPKENTELTVSPMTSGYQIFQAVGCSVRFVEDT